MGLMVRLLVVMHFPQGELSTSKTGFIPPGPLDWRLAMKWTHTLPAPGEPMRVLCQAGVNCTYARDGIATGSYHVWHNGKGSYRACSRVCAEGLQQGFPEAEVSRNGKVHHRFMMPMAECVICHKMTAHIWASGDVLVRACKKHSSEALNV